jgi:EAL domain-containing protein (putative c-di-GMP-specific phosphodiesterase class I)
MELEITEGVLLAADRGTAEHLRALWRARFRLALDDFRTGYS